MTALSSVPDLFSFFHGISRFDSSFQKAPNTPTLLGGLSNSYVQGVITQGGGVEALAVLYALGFSLALIIARVCCRSQKMSTIIACGRVSFAGWRRACIYSNDTGFELLLFLTPFPPSFFPPQFSYVTYAILAFLLISGAMYVTSLFIPGLGDAILSLRLFSSTLSTVASEVSGPLASSLATISGNATGINAICIATPPGCSLFQSDVDTFISTAASSLATAQTLGSDLATASLNFQTQLGLSPAAKFDLQATYNTLKVYSWAVLGLLAGWLLLHLLTLIPTKLGALAFRGCTLGTLLIGTLAITLTAALYAVAIVGSDVCISPGPTIVRIVNETGAVNAIGVSTLSYYTTCSSTGSAGGGTDVPSQLQAASNSLGLATFQVNRLVSTLQDPPLANLSVALTPTLNNILAAIGASNATLASATPPLLCAPLASVWNSLVSSLCSTATKGVGVTFFILLSASCLVIIMSMNAVVMCCRHQGDEGSAFDDTDGGLESVEDWGGATSTKSPLLKGKGSAWGEDTNVRKPAYY
jgi:hypothetical protein